MGLFIQGATKITQNNGRVDGGAVPDRQLDANSGNAIANDVVTGVLSQSTSGKFILPDGLKICWGEVGAWNGEVGSDYRITNYPVTFTSKPIVVITPSVLKSQMQNYMYIANYDESASSTTQLKCTPIWISRSNPSSSGWSADTYRYIAIGY